MEITTTPENDQEKISRLEAENSMLRAEKAVLEALSQTDTLTEIPNRRALEFHLEKELAHVKRGKGNLAVIMLDIDNYKAVNDLYSHGQGDVVLKETARALVKSIRIDDFAGRFGGEEFILILADPGTELIPIIQRIRENLSQIKRSGVENTQREEKNLLTASIGCVLIPRGSQNLTNEKILKLADDEMYKAKNTAGKNTFSITTYQDTL